MFGANILNNDISIGYFNPTYWLLACVDSYHTHIKGEITPRFCRSHWPFGFHIWSLRICWKPLINWRNHISCLVVVRLHLITLPRSSHICCEVDILLLSCCHTNLWTTGYWTHYDRKCFQICILLFFHIVLICPVTENVHVSVFFYPVF